ncbi:endonuclease/exonuclease/phosphatase family protein [Nocardioides humi]|uniref:Endonuclease/Exonuclease/phosphatase family protein n=1 Tax=Nocardioides humi TaxID=449461 RepID=A0ABN2AQN3_9ACTN|nr:hypothetical protein [Nocardioides humi]
MARLPAVAAPVPMRFPGRGLPTWMRDEPRVAVTATVTAPGGPLTIATTHLSFVRWWNRRQLRRLVRSLSGAPRPLLLTGDLNMGAARAARLSGLTPLAQHPTFPADPALPARSVARRMALSDHRALVVDVEAG